MTKLVIQIPCYNEERSILTTLNDLPSVNELDGIDDLAVLVIDDGSDDKSAEMARNWGAEVVEIKPNKGLANAFHIGIQESLNRGADIIVNTDADNQYCAKDISKLIQPILDSSSDIVIGARDISNIKEFSFLKKCLQKIGSAVIRLISSTEVKDAPSGFRAFSRDAAIKINVFDNYTYTMETIVQAKAKGLRIVSVPIEVNPKLRDSKLVKNIFSYVFKSMKTTIRMFIVYRPFRFFITLAAICGIIGLLVVARFLNFYFNGSGNGHVQSLVMAAIFLLTAVQLCIIAVIGDLFSINRRLSEDIQVRLKKLELDKNLFINKE